MNIITSCSNIPVSKKKTIFYLKYELELSDKHLISNTSETLINVSHSIRVNTMLLLTLLALVVTGCGKTTEESQPITLNTGLESPVEIPIFGKIDS